MKQFVSCVSSFFEVETRRRGREGEDSVYWGQQTDVIEDTPAVKIQSVSLFQELTLNHVQFLKFPWLAICRFADEENQEEDEESGLVDDEEDVDEINHETLPKVVVRAHSPGKRAHRSLVCHHVRHITKHDVSDHAIHGDCTHVCVYPLSDGEGGVKFYSNMSLKVFRATKKVSLQVRQLHLGEYMQTSGIQGVQSFSSKYNTYGLSENEKVLSIIHR